MIMGGINIALRPINMLGGIVLARLLDPADYGVIALAMVFLGSTELFAFLSMGSALIQSTQDPKKVAFHAFTITVVSSVLLFVFTIVNADWLSILLGDPDVASVLRALSPLIVIHGVAIVPAAIIMKNLEFGAVAKSATFSSLTYTLVSILLAYFGFGVWSLVIGQLVSAIVGTGAIWLLTPGWDWLRPVRWESDIFRSLMRFGIPATASGFVSFFSSKWDDWLVGRRLGVEQLGFYSKAYDFTFQNIRLMSSKVVGDVMYPTYTHLLEEKERLLRAYKKSVQLVSTMMFPVGLGFLATAPLLIPVLLGEKWLPMTTTFQVFSIVILTRPISANTSLVFNAQGHPKYNLQAGLVLAIVLVPMTLLLVPYGIAGVAVAVLVSDMAGLFVNLYRIDRTLPGSAKETIRASMPSLAAAVTMMLVVIGLSSIIVPVLGSTILALVVLIVSGVFVYVGLIFLIQREFTVDIFMTMIQVVDVKGRLAHFRTAG